MPPIWPLSRAALVRHLRAQYACGCATLEHFMLALIDVDASAVMKGMEGRSWCADRTSDSVL
jgi:hypothetical protein